MAGRLRRLAPVLPNYAKIAWWGLVRPRVGDEKPLVVSQAVILSGDSGWPVRQLNSAASMGRYEENMEKASA